MYYWKDLSSSTAVFISDTNVFARLTKGGLQIFAFGQVFWSISTSKTANEAKDEKKNILLTCSLCEQSAETVIPKGAARFIIRSSLVTLQGQKSC